MADRPPPQIRFGILGCASIARKLARAITLAPNAVVVAVGSRSPSKAAAFIAETGLGPEARTCSYDELLADPAVDAVYVPLPTSLHAQWATAAAKAGKHVLLEKPVALDVRELDGILAACRSAGVQYMDSTMFMHHPRTAAMSELLDPTRFGNIKMINSVFSFSVGEDFLRNDIRVKPDLDALGALGDAGWYCIRAALFAVNYELPKTAIALHGAVKNDAGVLLACGATLLWEDGKVATFQCSFLANLTMDITVIGTHGTLHATDFIVPYEETSASFKLDTKSGFRKLHNGWEPLPSEHIVANELPQEALMVQEFARLAAGIRHSGGKPDEKWPEISRKTQLVLDAVKASLDRGLEAVDVAA